MQRAIQKKSKEISGRIMAIKADIQSHRENIRLLNIYAKETRAIKVSPFVPRIVKYSSLPRSDTQFRWTLQNIRNQVALLERELETLIKYGIWGQSI